MAEGAAHDQTEAKANRLGIFGKYAYGWITLAFFLGSLVLHWWFGWRAFENEAETHGEAARVGAYLDEMLRDTFENWQSEFLQLMWQVIGLAYFLYVGSPTSKENDDRLEAKIDELIRLQAGDRADGLLKEIDARFLRTGGHADPFAHDGRPGR